MKKNVKKVKGTDVCPDCYDEYIAQMSSSESEEVSKICICLKQDLNVFSKYFYLFI